MERIGKRLASIAAMDIAKVIEGLSEILDVRQRNPGQKGPLALLPIAG